MQIDLDNGDRNLLISALGLLLIEARRDPEYVCDPDEVTELCDRIQYG